jgi:hypothetical protein
MSGPIDYWKECISVGAEECGLPISQEQIDYIAERAMYAHEEYGMAFYTPPATDRVSDMKREFNEKIEKEQRENERFRKNAENAIKSSLKLSQDSRISIDDNGEVYLVNGRTTRIL